jgi:hypothetical protein
MMPSQPCATGLPLPRGEGLYFEAWRPILAAFLPPLTVLHSSRRLNCGKRALIHSLS